MNSPHKASFSVPSQTQTLGTPIVALINPFQNAIARVHACDYESAGTAHTLVFMKSLGETNLSAAAAAGATSLTLDAITFGAAQTLAANDYIAVELTGTGGKKTWQVVQLSAINTTTKVVTVGALAAAAVSGAKVHIFGAAADTGHQSHVTKASTINKYVCSAPGAVADSGYEFESGDEVYRSNGMGKPILVYSANGTAAGTLHYAAGAYYAY